MATKLFVRSTQLDLKVQCTVYVPGPEKWNIMPTEIKEEIERNMEELVFPQYFGSMKKVIDSFKRSPLPDRLIYKQKVSVYPLNYKASYNTVTREVFIDNDALNGIFETAECYFGHEIGHKMLFNKASDDILSQVMDVIEWHNIVSAHEIFSHATGNVLDGKTNLLEDFIPNKKVKALERLALYLAWR